MHALKQNVSCPNPTFSHGRHRASPSARPVVAVRASSAEGDEVEEDKVPPGCARYEVKLKRPLGLVLEEDKQGNIFVVEIVEDGNASKAGLVNVGDQLLYTSAAGDDVYET